MSSSDSKPATRRPRRRRWIKGLGVVVALLTLAAVGLLIDAWEALGQGASGARLARMQRSAQWDGDGFENPEPLWNDIWGSISGMASGSDYSVPDSPLDVVRPRASLFTEAPQSGLRVTWLGHSTLLIEIDGRRILTDPVWGEYSSPFTWTGPERWYAPPIALEDLPPIDAVLISHDHYDHLDHPTMVAMRDWDTVFVVPLGVGAHLVYWGIPADRIVVLDWWERTQVGDLTVVCTPARHASGRQVFDQNDTLWAGYALLGDTHRVMFTGDTGLFDGMREIGRRLGPFDLTMIEVGAYNRAWPDWHLGPEQAVLAHRMLRGRAMLPIHWGLFDLAMHGWTEPIERTVVAAEAQDIRLLTPRPGQPFELDDSTELARWWPEVPWESAEEHAIEATSVDRRVD